VTLNAGTAFSPGSRSHDRLDLLDEKVGKALRVTVNSVTSITVRERDADVDIRSA
jgi:hypothetical protein